MLRVMLIVFPVNFCENTLASTRSALKNGANAIEVDVAISKDNVVFLWHDPYPLGIVALARRWANNTYGPFIFGGSSLRLRKICLMALYLTAHCLRFRLSKAKMTKYIKWLK